MMYSALLQWIGNIVVLSLVVPLAIFVFRYSTFSPWKATELGRALLYQKLAFTLVICISILTLFFPGIPFRLEIRLVALLFVLYSLWYDVVNLIRIQRKYPLTKKSNSK